MASQMAAACGDLAVPVLLVKEREISYEVSTLSHSSWKLSLNSSQKLCSTTQEAITAGMFFRLKSSHFSKHLHCPFSLPKVFYIDMATLMEDMDSKSGSQNRLWGVNVEDSDNEKKELWWPRRGQGPQGKCIVTEVHTMNNWFLLQ